MPSRTKDYRLRTVYIAAMGVVVAGASLWWARPLLEQGLATAGWTRAAPVSSPIIPRAFQGRWVEDGAECGDLEAEAHVDGRTVNYDRLSFVVERILQANMDGVTLAGRSFPDGDARATTVELLWGAGSRLHIVSADLGSPHSFVRCD